MWLFNDEKSDDNQDQPDKGAHSVKYLFTDDDFCTGSFDWSVHVWLLSKN